MKLRIKITKEVLETTKTCGLACSSNSLKLKSSETTKQGENCAVTYIFRELFPTCITGMDAIYTEYGEKAITIAHLPVSVSEFIQLFDTSSPNKRARIKPFDFEIELTEEALELITIEEVVEVLKTSTTLEWCTPQF